MRRLGALLGVSILALAGCAAEIEPSGPQARQTSSPLPSTAVLASPSPDELVRATRGDTTPGEDGYKRMVVSGEYRVEVGCVGPQKVSVTYWLVVDDVVDSWARVRCGSVDTFPVLLHADGRQHEVTLRVGGGKLEDDLGTDLEAAWFYARLLKR